MMTKDLKLEGKIVRLAFNECDEQFPLLLGTDGENRLAVFVSPEGLGWEQDDIPEFLCAQQHLFDQVVADLLSQGYPLHRPDVRTLQ